MAPGASSLLVDLRAQVIENCEFFSGPYAHLSLIIAKEPLGTFRAIVLRTENGTREALLSETAPSLNEALQALHVKSAEAVQNYISSNGFALASSVKNRRSRLDSDDDDVGSDDSTVTLDECGPLSDDETASVTSVGRTKRSGRKANKPGKTSSTRRKVRQGRARCRSPSLSTGRGRSLSSCSSSSSYEPHYDPPTIPSRRPPIFHGFSQRIPPRPAQNTFPFMLRGHHPAPPPPPPGPPRFTSAAYSGPPARPSPFSFNKPPLNTANATTVTPSPTPTSSNDQHPTVHQSHSPHQQPQQQPLHDLVLHIRWRHHGERRVLEQTPHMTVRGLQQSALSFVRRRAASFTNGSQDNKNDITTGIAYEGDHSSSNNPTAHHYQHHDLSGLRATLRSVVVNGVAYDLTGWVGDDLGRLVESLGCSSPSAVSSSPSLASSATATGAATGSEETQSGRGAGGGRQGGVTPMPMFEVEVWGDTYDEGLLQSPQPEPPLPRHRQQQGVAAMPPVGFCNVNLAAPGRAGPGFGCGGMGGSGAGFPSAGAGSPTSQHQQHQQQQGMIGVAAPASVATGGPRLGFPLSPPRVMAST
ncbi:hypothetical protein VTI28DRAFT_3612 [Corynascus sepedonium]